jgi:prepilin-type N-terminal cleavage/methylation domain-containing protein
VKNRGFTLVEILVVMSILGLLLTGLVNAVNPAEQIAKSKDSNRERAILDLGKSIHAYSIVNPSDPFPAANSTWQDTLVSAGELNDPAQVNNVGGLACNTNAQGNICYTTDGTNAIVWTLAESSASKKRAGGICTSDPNNNYAAYAWIASKGRIGLTCLGSSSATVPSYTTTLN